MQKSLAKGLQYVVLSIILALFLVPGTAVAAERNWGERERDGLIRGTDTHFETTSDEKLIKIDSSEELSLYFLTARNSMTLRTEASTTSTQSIITISGLTPNFTYHRYTDDYHAHEVITTDENGSYTFVLNLEEAHSIFIQPHRSTYFISDDATGGDCTSIGTWSITTKTCTLTQDLFETVQIDSDGITLDGNNHTIDGGYQDPFLYTTGIFVSGKNNVTIQNVTVAGFMTAVNFSYGQNNTITDSAILGGTEGVVVAYEDNITITNNLSFYHDWYAVGLTDVVGGVISNNNSNEDGAWLDISYSDDIEIKNNTILDPYYGGILIFASSGMMLTDNKVTGLDGVSFGIDAGFEHSLDTSNTINGKLVYYIKDASNQTFDETTNAGILYCIRCTNVTFEGFAAGDLYQEIVLVESDGIVLQDNVIEFTIIMEGSNKFTIRNNTFSTNGAIIWAPGFLIAYDSYIYNNNILGEIHSSRWDFEWNKSLPIGGNYWGSYNETGEGCIDVDLNGICDTPYDLTTTTNSITGIDHFPWTAPNGWENPPVPNPTPDPEDTTAPVISNITVTAATSSVSVSWDTDEDATGTAWYGVTTPLDVGGSATNIEALTVSSSQSVTIPDLQPGTQYFFLITATDASGNIGESTENIFETLTPQPTCCSNVAFLPGHQGSRLYRNGAKLWPPFNGRVEELYLKPSGASLNYDIVTKDIIDTALTVDIYSGFIDFMDTDMVNADVINEWKALPYDWRLSFYKILESGKKTGDYISYLYPTSTPYIIQELNRLADTSKNGKVTLVTHSNGGLLAKALLQKLEDENDPLLQKIDKVIMVAAPQIGTPAAIEALLHGDRNQVGLDWIDFGIVIDEEEVREFGENMQSAYNLLPTKKYFDIISSPVIHFSNSVYRIPSLASRALSWVTSALDLNAFLLGDGVRTEPDSNDEESPNVLKENLLVRAIETHEVMDAWIPPVNIEVIQIAGWGADTVKGINYSCQRGTCFSLSTLDRRMAITSEGDGTVVYPSAHYLNSSNYFVNILEYNDDFGEELNHKNIFEINSLQLLAKLIILERMDLTNPLTYITQTKPIETRPRYRLALHSPVGIDIYDSEGRRTGFDEETGKTFEEIPNSYYWDKGGHKYLGLDGRDIYHIELQGEDVGTFTLEINKVLSDVTVGGLVFIDIPTSPEMEAEISIEIGDATQELQIDIDGNGSFDVTLTGNNETDTPISLTILGEIIENTEMFGGLKTELVAKLNIVKKLQEKENVEGVVKELNKIIVVLTKEIRENEKHGDIGNYSKIPTETAEKFITIIDKVADNLLR